ncbi:GGDEF domain-containing protein [Lysobacter humi (ex Lee et al. 2017)]
MDIAGDAAARGRLDIPNVVRARVLALAPVLAALTVAWAVLDILVLPRGGMLPVLGTRLAIAAALLLIARSRQLPTGLLLRAFLWVQALGYGLLQALFLPDADSVLAIGYGLAPFVIAAQLALFPLRWTEVLRLGLAPLVALGLVHRVHLPEIDAGMWSDAWLLVLLLGVAAWTSDAQRRLLVALVGAREDAGRDPLTGLANRRMTLARLGTERERARRHDSPLSLLMLDLDRFKAVNDRWGHPAGDVVLRTTASAIAAELRACDLGARFGGEEFLVLLPDTAGDDAARVAERIRRRIAALEIDVGEAMLQVTVSIGLATLHGDEAIEAAIGRADAALYRAKAGGRDRVVADDAVAGLPA